MFDNWQYNWLHLQIGTYSSKTLSLIYMKSEISWFVWINKNCEWWALARFSLSNFFNEKILFSRNFLKHELKWLQISFILKSTFHILLVQYLSMFPFGFISDLRIYSGDFWHSNINKTIRLKCANTIANIVFIS